MSNAPVASPNIRNRESEHAPLLTGDREIHGQDDRPREATRSDDAQPLSKLILYFMTIHFLLAFAEIILVAPLIRLFENSLCLSHYGFPNGGVKEVLCKIPEVQQPLATIRGWKSLFDTVPGMNSHICNGPVLMVKVLLVAIPIGRLGDCIGRRKIMALSLLGVAGSLTEIFVVCKSS